MTSEGRLYYCGAFPNNGAIQAIVRANTARDAQRAARDSYYGTPAVVRIATEDEISWHEGFGGTIIEAVRP